MKLPFDALVIRWVLHHSSKCMDTWRYRNNRFNGGTFSWDAGLFILWRCGMFFRKTGKIKDMVGKHTEAVLACYDKYEESLRALIKGCGMAELNVHSGDLRRLESEADHIRRQIIRQLLEGGLVMDSRKSIMHVIEEVDGIADLAEDIIQEIHIQELQLPKLIHEPLLAMTEVTRHQLMLLIGLVKGIVDKYDELEMTKVTQEIETMESKVDNLQHEVVRELYKQDMSLAEKMQLREIINMAGHIADLIEDNSDEVEIIMLARKV